MNKNVWIILEDGASRHYISFHLTMRSLRNEMLIDVAKYVKLPLRRIKAVQINGSLYRLQSR